MDRRKRTARTVALMSLFSMTDTQENVPVASFVGDGSDLISLIVGIEPIQAGSGDPSPDNVRPISGWAGANIHVSPTTDAADGETYSITFPTSAGTVYGGTLDVLTGVLTVDRAYTELSELWYWTKSSSYPGGYFASTESIGAKSSTPFICSHAKTVTIVADYVFGTCYCDGSANFRLMGENSTLQDWLDYIVAQRTNGTPITICYELATPIVYDLAPTEINTLIGTNNIWADTGEIKYIEYNV